MNYEPIIENPEEIILFINSIMPSVFSDKVIKIIINCDNQNKAIYSTIHGVEGYYWNGKMYYKYDQPDNYFKLLKSLDGRGNSIKIIDIYEVHALPNN